MDEIIKSLRSWNPWLIKGWEPPATIPRSIKTEITQVLNLKHIKDVIGVRRCGKTTLLCQITAELLKKGVKPAKIIFVNFDDIVINTADFDSIIKAIYRVSPKAEYLFLDEVQEKRGWERWVRTLYDTNRFRQIFVTGSSASLLSKDLGRVLTGRHISFQLLPFSFKEFLLADKWNKFDPNYLLAESDRLLHYIERYLTSGGFPETIGKGEHEIQRILTNIFNDILARDVAARHKIEGEKVNLLAKYLLTNFTREYSLRRIATNIGINIETVERYLGFLEEAFLVFNLNLFSFKLKTQFKQNKKIYAVDNGLRNHVSFRFSEDYGKLAENAVFLELKRRGKEVYYWKSRKTEVDFVVRAGTSVKELIQVCWNLDDRKTKQRELNGLFAAGRRFNLKNGMIITSDFSGEEVIEGFKVNYVPLALWLLGVDRTN